MASELEARIIYDFAEDIASELKEAAIIAQTASGAGCRACRSAHFGLEIETLIHDASILLNATPVGAGGTRTERT